MKEPTDHTTIYFGPAAYNKANKTLTNDIKVVLNLSIVNTMVVNPGKFQILFLGLKFDNTSIRVMIKNKNVNVLRIAVNNKSSLDKLFRKLCNNASKRQRPFRRMRKYLSTEQAKCLLEVDIKFWIVLTDSNILQLNC